MINKINLVEILKDAPQGTKLYSPIFGECELEEVRLTENIPFPIIVEVCSEEGITDTQFFTKYGYFAIGYDSKAECMLFPSKDCKDWEHFVPKWKFKAFKPFQKVLYKSAGIWTPKLYGYLALDSYAPHHVFADGKCCFDADIIPYEGNESLTGKTTE